MKKIFVAVMAMAAFAACSNEEQIAAPKGQEIAFGDAFVDNATKAIYESADDITGFTVWGNVKGTGDVVALYGDTGANVTRNSEELDAAWNCDVVRYWTPSCDYSFVAIANGIAAELTNGVPTKIGYTVNASEPADLIYGATTAKTDGQSNPIEGVNSNKVVAFTMQHLLSRVKVSFKNELDSENATDYRYTISDVKVVTAGSGTYDIAENSWALGNEANLSYTGVSPIANGTTESYGAQLVIPTSPVKLVFTYALELKTGTDTWTAINSGTVTKESVIASPVKNNSYNITVQLKAGAKIDFTVAEENGLTGFGSDSNVNVQ